MQKQQTICDIVDGIYQHRGLNFTTIKLFYRNWNFIPIKKNNTKWKFLRSVIYKQHVILWNDVIYSWNIFGTSKTVISESCVFLLFYYLLSVFLIVQIKWFKSIINFKTISVFALCCDVKQLSQLREQLHSQVHVLVPNWGPISSDLRGLPYDIIVPILHCFNFCIVSAPFYSYPYGMGFALRYKFSCFSCNPTNSSKIKNGKWKQ